MELASVDWDALVRYSVSLTVAILAALPTALDREVNDYTLGLRSFPLVSLGSCAYVLVATSFVSPESDPEVFGRVLQGLMGGIGFVGGGAILKNDDHVSGTASAASIWVTGALGAAAALQIWELVALLSVLNVVIVVGFSRAKKEMGSSKSDNE